MNGTFNFHYRMFINFSAGQLFANFSCVPCGSGTVDTGQSCSTVCAAGNYVQSLTLACLACTPGIGWGSGHIHMGRVSCVPCIYGTVDMGQSCSTVCAAGNYVQSLTLACLACTPGIEWGSGHIHMGRVSCVPCGYGTVDTGQSCSTVCAAGNYVQSLTLACLACTPGTGWG